MKRLALVVVLAAAGCAVLPVSTDGIMSEAVRLSRAPAGAQKAAVARAQQEFEADPGPLERVRLAALLATLPPPLRDDARAAELLEPVADPASPGAGRFAAFLAAQIAERQRLLREAERLAKERASHDRERQSADKERDKREEALRQQLEALRAIERGILEREERMRRKPGAKP
jgi:hypothetical protein